jgi:hypothetical protein
LPPHEACRPILPYVASAWGRLWHMATHWHLWVISSRKSETVTLHMTAQRVIVLFSWAYREVAEEWNTNWSNRLRRIWEYVMIES